MKKFTLLLFLLSAVTIGNAQSKYGWAKSFISDGGVVPVTTAVDVAGNVYTTGYFTDDTNFDPASGTQLIKPAGQDDIFIAKRDAGGNLLWVKTIGGINTDDPSGLALDASGNVYITGAFVGTLDFDPGPDSHTLSTAGSAYQSDIFILKLDAAGNYVWAKSIGGDNFDQSRAIAIDATGNIYLTGYYGDIVDFDPGAGEQFLQATGWADVFIAKFNADGDYVWAKSIDALEGWAMAVDAGSNVYITGTFSGAVDFNPGTGSAILTSDASQDVFFLKLNGAGNYVWAKQISSSTASLVPYGIAADATGALYATGWFDGTVDFDPAAAGIQELTSAGNEDVFITKLDASGNYEWATRIGDNKSDYGSSINVDALGNVYTTGHFSGVVDVDPGADMHALVSAGGADIFIVKLTVDGEYAWAANVGGASDDLGTSITTAGVNNIYLAGIFQGTADFDPGNGSEVLSTPGGGAFMLQLIPAGNLPLTLLNFEAVDNYNTVQLLWQTTREENMVDFTIQRSANGKQFESIGSVAVNNSFNLVSNYAFTDAHPLTTTSYYRLKIKDANGSYTYSRTIPVKRQGKAQSIQVSPNPASQVLYVQIDAQEAITLQIADVSGHVVYQQNKAINGNTTFPVSLQGLPAGNYYLIMKGKTIQKTLPFLKR